jgi:hypothetical protein
MASIQKSLDPWKKPTNTEKIIEKSWKPGMMVHVCNLSYSGGKDRRIESSRPARPCFRLCLKTKQKQNG